MDQPLKIPPMRARTVRQEPEVKAALKAHGWTSRGAGPVKVWESENRPLLLTAKIDGEFRVFVAADRWPIDRLAAGVMPRL